MSESLDEKIRKQLEFYFGDSNLSRDRFLRQQIDGSEEGWVGIDVLLTFNKLKSMTTDATIIANALKSSSLLETNEANTKIRRKSKLPGKQPADTDWRTIYMENLPTNATHESIRLFFVEKGLEAVFVSLPHGENGNLHRGFAFVEFKLESQAKSAANLYYVKIGDVQVRLMTKHDWLKLRDDYRKLLQTQTENEKRTATFHERLEQRLKFDNGLIINLKDLKDKLAKSTIKSALEFADEKLKIAYVDFKKEDTHAYVRLKHGDDIERIAKFTEEQINKLKERLGENMSLKILTPEDEAEYWLNADLNFTSANKDTSVLETISHHKNRDKNHHNTFNNSKSRAVGNGYYNKGKWVPKDSNNNNNDEKREDRTERNDKHEKQESTKSSNSSSSSEQSQQPKRKLPPGGPSSNESSSEPKNKKPKHE